MARLSESEVSSHVLCEPVSTDLDLALDAYDDLKQTLLTNSAVAGEASGYSMGLVMLGSTRHTIPLIRTAISRHSLFTDINVRTQQYTFSPLQLHLHHTRSLLTHFSTSAHYSNPWHSSRPARITTRRQPRQPHDNPIRLLEEALDARPAYLFSNPYHSVWSEIRADVARQRARAASPPATAADAASLHTVNSEDDETATVQISTFSLVLSIHSDTTMC